MEDFVRRMTNARVTAAVERALNERQREAVEEVERILDAALAVMERVTPAAPRVSDIVTEAGLSNAAFYRYFSGKDDLILAVLDRGVAMVASYLEHEMAKEASPLAAVARWVEGMLAQVADAKLARMSRAAITQLAALKDDEINEPLRRLLSEQVTAVGCQKPDLATDAVFNTVTGTVRHHIAAATQPSSEEIEHLALFCVKAIDPDVPPSKVRRRRRPQGGRGRSAKSSTK